MAAALSNMSEFITRLNKRRWLGGSRSDFQPSGAFDSAPNHAACSYIPMYITRLLINSAPPGPGGTPFYEASLGDMSVPQMLCDIPGLGSAAVGFAQRIVA